MIMVIVIVLMTLVICTLSKNLSPPPRPLFSCFILSIPFIPLSLSAYSLNKQLETIQAHRCGPYLLKWEVDRQNSLWHSSGSLRWPLTQAPSLSGPSSDSSKPHINESQKFWSKLLLPLSQYSSDWKAFTAVPDARAPISISSFLSLHVRS